MSKPCDTEKGRLVTTARVVGTGTGRSLAATHNMLSQTKKGTLRLRMKRGSVGDPPLVKQETKKVKKEVSIGVVEG